MKKKFDRRGVTVVEFALTLPVLLLVVFGSIELTRVAMLRHTANHAAYVATRNAIVPGADVADVILAAEQHLETVGIRGGSVTVSPSVIVDATTLVDVEVTFPVADNSLIVPEFVSGQIIGRSAMVTERPKGVMSLTLPEPPPDPTPPSDPSSPTEPSPSGGDPPPDPAPWPQTPPPKPPPPVL